MTFANEAYIHLGEEFKKLGYEMIECNDIYTIKQDNVVIMSLCLAYDMKGDFYREIIITDVVVGLIVSHINQWIVYPRINLPDNLKKIERIKEFNSHKELARYLISLN